MLHVYDADIRTYLRDFDFCLLVETFATKFPAHLFPDHDVFVIPGVRLSDGVTARLSGGLSLLIKTDLSKYVQQIEVEYDNIIVVKLSGELLDCNTPVILIGVYLPPASSAYYKDTEITNGVSMLEQCMLDLLDDETNTDCSFLLMGDFNARTGGKNVCECNDELGVDPPADDDDGVVFRTSKDTVCNEFGEMLLNLCKCFDLSILNGIKENDINFGHYTYISPTGCSIVDYFIVSHTLVSLCTQLEVKPRIESKHMPVELTIDCGDKGEDQNVKSKPIKIEKMKWDSEKENEFMGKLSEPEFKNSIERATSLIDSNIDEAVSCFSEALYNVSACMIKTIIVGKNKGADPWFDLECKDAKRELRHDLRKLYNAKTKRSNLTSRKEDCGLSDSDSKDRVSNVFSEEESTLRERYNAKRREYKELLRTKQKAHRENVVNSLHNNMNNAKEFWSKVRSFNNNTASNNSISKEEWFDHFSEVFQSNSVQSTESDNPIEPEIFPDEEQGQCNTDALEADITEDEIYASIRALKNGKAAGPDHIIGEVYKHAALYIVPFLLLLFNKLFTTGSYPSQWSESIIHPLHKKGDKNSPDNYRGISLLNICSKLYSHILKKQETDCNVTGVNNKQTSTNKCKVTLFINKGQYKTSEYFGEGAFINKHTNNKSEKKQSNQYFPCTRPPAQCQNNL